MFCQHNTALFFFAPTRQLPTQLTAWYKASLEKVTVTHLFNELPPFMECEGLFPCSQESTTDPCLGQMNPVCDFTKYFFKIRFNITFHLRSLKWSLPFTCPYQSINQYYFKSWDFALNNFIFFNVTPLGNSSSVGCSFSSIFLCFWSYIRIKNLPHS